MLIYDVILDVGTTGCQQTVSLYQGDDRSKMLRVTLIQDGRAYAVPSDLDVRLHAVKPDETEFSARCGVRGGSVYYLPAADMADTQGTVRCQLRIRDHSGAVLFTPEFCVQVVGTLPVPELPEGVSEDVEFNTEVLSALSASEDGKTLLFRGNPVGAVTVASELPQSAEEDAIVYLAGEGLFRRVNNAWTQLTDDETIATAALLQQDSHTHANKAAIDKLSESDCGELLFNGASIGIETVAEMPALAYPGKIVYYPGYGLFANTGTYQMPTWDIISVPAVGYIQLVGAKHTHENKTVLDGVTAEKVTAWDAAVTDRHTHANKEYLDGIASADLARWNGAAASAHAHANKSTLDKFTQSNGKLQFDGVDLGGVSTAATPNALPANAPNGSVAVALNNGMTTSPIAYPTQVADEEISVNIASTDLAIGTPVYNASAINAAIAAQTLALSATVTLKDPDGVIAFGVLPVVADAASNEYTAAGITLEEAIVAQSYTKKYAVSAFLTGAGLDIIKPARIVPVDAGHVQIPFMAIYVFEALSDVSYQGMTMDLAAGWNLALATIDTATYSDVTAIDVVNGVDLNDYVDLSNDAQNAMTIEGLRAAELFAGVIARASVLPGGLYVKLGTWKRMAEAANA